MEKYRTRREIRLMRKLITKHVSIHSDEGDKGNLLDMTNNVNSCYVNSYETRSR